MAGIILDLIDLTHFLSGGAEEQNSHLNVPLVDDPI